MTNPSSWIDGALVPAAEARVSPFDHGLLVGDGVFETLRVYRGVPFAWRRHLDRLEQSARALELVTPDRGVLRDAAESVLQANRLSEARLRITVTGGVQPLGSGRRPVAPTVIVAAARWEQSRQRSGVVVVPWLRNERGATAGLKTTSYAENVRALVYARTRGAGEAIFANTRGELCEAAGSNVFVVRDGRLCTPSLASGCLPGVTRALVIELSRAAGVGCDEVAIPSGTSPTRTRSSSPRPCARSRQ